MLWLEQAKGAANCDDNDYKLNMPRNKGLTYLLIPMYKVWAQLYKNCAQAGVFWQQRMDLEGPNKNPEFCIHHLLLLQHPVNSPSAHDGVLSSFYA